MSFRSKFESEIARQLDQLGVKWEYEAHTIPWMRPVQSGVCLSCKETAVAQICSYTPDFYLPEYDMFLEAKGKWDSNNRTMHRVIRRSAPDTDIRIVFQRDNWLTKRKAQTYTEWCTKYDLPSCVGFVPAAWFKRKVL